MELESVKIIENFGKWKQTLHKAIHISEAIGVKEDKVVDIAKKVGDFLSNNVETENPQQQLLKDLWDVGTDSEKHSLAHMLVKMVEQEHHSIH